MIIIDLWYLLITPIPYILSIIKLKFITSKYLKKEKPSEKQITKDLDRIILTGLIYPKLANTYLDKIYNTGVIDNKLFVNINKNYIKRLGKIISLRRITRGYKLLNPPLINDMTQPISYDIITSRVYWTEYDINKLERYYLFYKKDIDGKISKY